MNELEEEMQRWNEWFPLVGFAEEWETIKGACDTDAERIGWARIMELNRIDAVMEAKANDHSTATA